MHVGREARGGVVRIAVLGLFAFGLACFPPGWKGSPGFYLAPSGYPYQVGPYLVPLGSEKLAVVIRHPLPEPPSVEWHPVLPPNTAADETQVRRVVGKPYSDHLWVMVLDDLPIDRALTYRVVSSLGTSIPRDFVAGRSKGAPFRFAAFGDTRTNHKVHRALIDVMAEQNVDFVIHSGDMVDNGGDEPQWDLFMQIEHPLISRAPLFASVGNHDVSVRGYFQRYMLTALYAGDRRYYCKDWGSVRVVNLDSETELRKGSAQYAFLEACLRGGHEANQLMVISLHYPPYSSGQHGSYLEIRQVLGEIAPRYGVELILAGHDHNYERTKIIDGVTYIVSASGGAPIRPVYRQDFSAELRTEPHYVLFDVNDRDLVGRTINLAGDVFDSFIIKEHVPGVASR